MQKQRLILLITIGLFLIGNVYFIMKSYSLSKELAISQANPASVHKNENVISFTRLFVDKVLNADKEVDFDTRLQLENAVRDLKDVQILAGWQKFTESKTNAEAQQNVKDLLKILIMKAN